MTVYVIAPLFFSVMPSFTRIVPNSHMLQDFEGYQAQLKCKAQGVPAPVVKWYKNGAFLDPEAFKDHGVHSNLSYSTEMEAHFSTVIHVFMFVVQLHALDIDYCASECAQRRRKLHVRRRKRCGKSGLVLRDQTSL